MSAQHGGHTACCYCGLKFKIKQKIKIINYRVAQKSKPLLKSELSINGDLSCPSTTDRGILKRALMGCRSDSGGSPSANSMAVTPSDQTSQRTS